MSGLDDYFVRDLMSVQSPKNKHLNTPGMSALVEHTYVPALESPLLVFHILNSADEVMKGSAYLTEALTDPRTAHSEAPEEAALQVRYSVQM